MKKDDKKDNKPLLELTSMSKEQKLLLLKIYILQYNHFTLSMNDHWSLDDFSQSSFYNERIIKAIKEYNDLYGNLPTQVEFINDITKAIDELQSSLENDNK